MQYRLSRYEKLALQVPRTFQTQTYLQCISPVYLFDVKALGETLFSVCGMRSLLENAKVCKIVFDGRADNDAV